MISVSLKLSEVLVKLWLVDHSFDRAIKDSVLSLAKLRS